MSAPPASTPTRRDTEDVGLKSDSEASRFAGEAWGRYLDASAKAKDVAAAGAAWDAYEAELREANIYPTLSGYRRRENGTEMKYAPAAGNWIIEVDGQVVFEFSPEDEAEARLAYNQLKRKEPSTKLRRDKEAGHSEDTKSQPSDKISPAKARQILKDGEVHGKPLTEAQRGMFGAAAGRDRKADSSWGQLPAEMDQAVNEPTRRAPLQPPRPPERSEGAAEGDQEQADMDQWANRKPEYLVTFTNGSTTNVLDESGLYQYADSPDVADIQYVPGGGKGRKIAVDRKALSARAKGVQVAGSTDQAQAGQQQQQKPQPSTPPVPMPTDEMNQEGKSDASMPAQEQKASPAANYLNTLKEMAKAVRENPKDAAKMYEGADEAQAKVQEWLEAKEADLIDYTITNWNEGFDPDIMEKAEESGYIGEFKEATAEMFEELREVVEDADQAFEAVTRSAGEDGIDEEDWAEHIITQDALERFLADFPKRFLDLQEEFYQQIGEHQTEKSDAENDVWESEIEEAIEELESIEELPQAQQRAEEFNNDFREGGNIYRLVYEGNEWRYNDVETLQDEGYDVKGRHGRRGRGWRIKSALAGNAKGARAARGKASPTEFISTLSGMIEDAGSPAAHEAVDKGFNEAVKFIDAQGKQAIDQQIRDWQQQYGKEAVEVANDAVGHFKDDVKQALSDMRTAMEVAVNSYKAVSAAGVGGDPTAVEDATGDYEAAASELDSLMENFAQEFQQAAASCGRAIMAGRGQLAYESVTKKSQPRRRDRDYVAEAKVKLAEMRKGGKPPVGATFPRVPATPRVTAPTPAQVYAINRKPDCHDGCACHDCTKGRCYKLKFAPNMEGLDGPALDVEHGDHPPEHGPKIRLNKGAMSASCILATSAEDREGDVIDIAGVDLSIHQINPVVMLDHGVYYPLPIGMNRSPTGQYLVQKNVQAGEMTETTYFSQSSEMAEQVYGLIDEGIINANSLGFDPQETQPRRSANGRKGKLVSKCTMIESTWTPLPVNPEAVRSCLAKNAVNGRPLARAIKSMLVRRVPQAGVRKHWERSGVDKSAPAQAGTEEGEDGGVETYLVTTEEAGSAEEAAEVAQEYFNRMEPDAQIVSVEDHPFGWNVKYKRVAEQQQQVQDGTTPVHREPYKGAARWGLGVEIEIMSTPSPQGDIYSYVLYDDDQFGNPTQVANGGSTFDFDAALADAEQGAEAYCQERYDAKDPEPDFEHVFQTVERLPREERKQQWVKPPMNEKEAIASSSVENPRPSKVTVNDNIASGDLVGVADRLISRKLKEDASVDDIKAALMDEAVATIQAPEGSEYVITRAGKYDAPTHGDDLQHGYGYRVVINHPLLPKAPNHPSVPKDQRGYGASFFVGVDDEGKKFIRTEWIGVNDKYKGPNGGNLFFNLKDRQIRAAREAGFSYLSSHAIRGPKATGYYKVPEIGGDETIADMENDAKRFPETAETVEKIKKEYPDAQTVLEVIALAGMDWWKKNGCDLYRARFDLADGSDSMGKWNRYKSERTGSP